MRFVALLTITVAACGFPKLQPVGNGSGTGDGGGGDSTGSFCAASTPLRCEGNMLVSCNSQGTAEVQESCALRCDASTLVCENKVAPSNGYAPQLDAAATEPNISIAATTMFVTTDYNASTGTVKIGSQLVKAAVVPNANGGPDVLVMSVGSMTIPAGVTLTILSDGSTWREVAFMSAGDVSILGTLKRAESGLPGSNDPCTGVSSNAAGADNDVPGGGGGAYGGAGAEGGSIVTVTTKTPGGAVTGEPTLVPLRPGCWGGNTAGLGAGGSGGGAIQITSGTHITVSGALGAPGYGGSVNAGGGAGGAILLEAPIVTIAAGGGVYANGGSGGCGSFTQSGSEGDMSTSPALGGPCSNGQSGGNGGAGTTAPTDGQSLANTVGTKQYAGGGGGGVGRIRINTLDMTVAGTGALSPPASLGVVAGR